MHILSVPEQLDLYQQGIFAPGEYLVEDQTGANLMSGFPQMKMKMREFVHRQTADVTPQRILVMGGLGFGDAMMITPVLRALASKEGTEVHVSCFKEQQQVFLNLPYVHGFAEYPLPHEQLKTYDRVIFLEGSVEYNELAKTQHMTDRFAENAGMVEMANKKPDYVVSSEEREWVFSSFPKTGKKRLGIQIQPGVKSRHYPTEGISVVVNKLVKKGWEVYFMGRPGEFMMQEQTSIFNLSRHGLTFRQSAAFLLTCDAFLGPDSSLLHASGCLDIPAVGLFGPFPWKLRTAYYTSVHALQGKEGCPIAPCFHIQHGTSQDYPSNGPCAKSGRCDALASITPDRIIGKIEQITNETVTA